MNTQREHPALPVKEASHVEPVPLKPLEVAKILFTNEQ